MNLDPDPKTARQQVFLYALTLVSTITVVSTVGLGHWYAPLLAIAPTIVAVAVIVYRARRERKGVV